MVDKNYCMSSYLAFRYIEADDKDFFPGLHHSHIAALPEDQIHMVKTADEIDKVIADQFSALSDAKLGILLSGGMDSAILASYMRGCDAYTFRFLGGTYQEEELNRAKYYANYYGLRLHYVDIDWEETVKPYLPPLMRAKAAPCPFNRTSDYAGSCPGQSGRHHQDGDWRKQRSDFWRDGQAALTGLVVFRFYAAIYLHPAF